MVLVRPWSDAGVRIKHVARARVLGRVAIFLRCIYTYICQQHMHERIYLLPTPADVSLYESYRHLVVVPALAAQVPSSVVNERCRSRLDTGWLRSTQDMFCFPQTMDTAPPPPPLFDPHIIERLFSRTPPGHSTAAAPALTKRTTLRQRSVSTLVRYTAGSTVAGRKRYAFSHGSPFTSAVRLIAFSM